MKKIALLLGLLVSMLFMFAGCGETAASNTSDAQTAQQTTAKSLEGKTIFIYSGAGMKKAVNQLTAAFEAETGATVQVTYANAANIITQITTSNEGDVFIAGDKGELSALTKKDYIASAMDLVKHIPVLAVQKGNPKAITGLADLTKSDVTVVLGDNKATPIGKLSDKALSELGILNSVNVISRTTTANEIATSLSLGQCDAGITWKENISDVEGTEIVDTADLNKYIKTVPAAALTCSTNTEATTAFMKFLASDKAKTIWQNNGYELLD